MLVLLHNDINDLDNISLDWSSYEHISIFDVTCKTPYNVNPLRIIFDEVDGSMKKYDRTKYLALFPPDKSMKDVW